MMENPIFRQNVIIITGASMGIGRELAFQFAKQGAWLALAARNAEKLEEISQQCRQLGGRSISIPTDIAYQAQTKNWYEETKPNMAGSTHWSISRCRYDEKFDQLKDFLTLEKVMQVNFGAACIAHIMHYPISRKAPGGSCAYPASRKVSRRHSRWLCCQQACAGRFF